MGHRGPDGQGTLSDEQRNITLEHCRLAIIDPENTEADQPYTDPSGRWVIVYNGEIFNFKELRARLERRGARFRTNSDTEVLLQAYIFDGVAAFEQLRGMFAFLIWDRESGDLVAARDQIGVKPLYYTATSDGVFAAASELRTLIGHPGVRARLDPDAVVEYLAFGHTANDETLLDGVHKLPPGHLLRISGGAVEVREYWDPLPAERVAADGAVQELSELLERTVADSIVSDVPVSLMLSGGLDSSTIAVLAARHIDPAALTAYSVSFGLASDETRAAARLASDLGIRFREVRVQRGDVETEFDQWLARMDVPSANPTWIAVSHIARAVHTDGGKVLLSGDGGDELMGGYNRWMKYVRFHDRVWARTPTGARRLAGRATRSLAPGLAGDIARRASDGGELFVGSRPFHDSDLRHVLGPAGQRAAASRSPEWSVRELRRNFDQRNPDGDYLAWMSYVGLKRSMVEDFLARLDKMGMQESVEGRVPLLDAGLAKWSFGVPQALKIGSYEQKALMRRAVAPMLPDYVLAHPKQGFCPPVADWAVSLLPSRIPSHSILIDDGLIAPGAIERLVKQPSSGNSFALWTLGTLAVWCEQNL